MGLTRSFVEAWEKSIGTDFEADHYRESSPGRRHAVCQPEKPVCDVHYDKYNAHSQTLDHLAEEAPEVILSLLVGTFIGRRNYNTARKPWESLAIGAIGAGGAYVGLRALKEFLED